MALPKMALPKMALANGRRLSVPVAATEGIAEQGHVGLAAETAAGWV